MLKFVNALLVMAVIGAAGFLYSLEHKSRKGERDIVRLKAEIKQEHENIRLLKAEWSRLARPQRLEVLARDHLDLKPLKPEQTVPFQSLAGRLPERPPDPPHASRSDPIAKMLEAIE